MNEIEFEGLPAVDKDYSDDPFQSSVPFTVKSFVLDLLTVNLGDFRHSQAIQAMLVYLS